MRLTATAYPWDVIGDASFIPLLRDQGIEELVVAAAYHAVRAASPRHPSHILVDAAHAAFYAPVRDAAWTGAELRPVGPGDWAPADAFLQAAEAAREQGMPVAAWLVLTHSSALGARRPDLVVRNAFGDRYSYALCPSSAQVRGYARTMVGEAVAQSGVRRVVLEACGPLGFGHLGLHEKTAAADWTSVDDDLLSLCFCGRCRDAYAEAGIDVEALAARVRAAVGRGSLGLEDAVGADADRVLEVREAFRRLLAGDTAQAARIAGARDVTAHASLRRAATGPFAAVCDGDPPRDVLMLSGDEARDLGAEGIAAARERTTARIAVAENVARGSIEQVVRDVRAVRALGVDELCVGHLGLLGQARLEAVLSAL